MVTSPDGLSEPSRFRLPGRAPGDKVEGMAEVPVRGGVLVQPAGQVGQSIAKVPAGHNGGVQERPGGPLGYRRRLVIGHARQHLNVYRHT